MSSQSKYLLDSYLCLARHHSAMAMGLVLNAELLQLSEHGFLIHVARWNANSMNGRPTREKLPSSLEPAGQA